MLFQVYKEMVDFDNHLDDITQDYLNVQMNYVIDEAMKTIWNTNNHVFNRNCDKIWQKHNFITNCRFVWTLVRRISSSINNMNYINNIEYKLNDLIWKSLP